MKKKLLFVHLPGPTYTKMADEIYNPNHDSYGLADGDEQSPTVSSRLQRSERKYRTHIENPIHKARSRWLSKFILWI